MSTRRQIHLIPRRHSVLAPPSCSFVCSACFAPKEGEGERCNRCADVDAEPLDAFAPISYGWNPEDELHRAIRLAKGELIGASLDAAAARAGLLWTLEAFALSHEACLARAAGLGPSGQFDVVVAVPPGSPEAPHPWPFAGVVALVPSWTTRFVWGLRTLRRGTRGEIDAAIFDADALRGSVAQKSVLLVDDVWTTGGTMRSAARAVREAGAACVAGVVVERHVNRDYGPTAAHWEEIIQTRPDATCVHCRHGRT